MSYFSELTALLADSINQSQVAEQKKERLERRNKSKTCFLVQKVQAFQIMGLIIFYQNKAEGKLIKRYLGLSYKELNGLEKM